MRRHVQSVFSWFPQPTNSNRLVRFSLAASLAGGLVFGLSVAAGAAEESGLLRAGTSSELGAGLVWFGIVMLTIVVGRVIVQACLAIIDAAAQAPSISTARTRAEFTSQPGLRRREEVRTSQPAARSQRFWSEGSSALQSGLPAHVRPQQMDWIRDHVFRLRWALREWTTPRVLRPQPLRYRPTTQQGDAAGHQIVTPPTARKSPTMIYGVPADPYHYPVRRRDQV